jgi:hypothetical protein
MQELKVYKAKDIIKLVGRSQITFPNNILGN